MDPQQRLLLELGYGALHQAGVPRGSLLESDTAVFVGVMSVEFREALPHANAYAMTGTGHCFPAGRLGGGRGVGARSLRGQGKMT